MTSTARDSNRTRETSTTRESGRTQEAGASQALPSEGAATIDTGRVFAALADPRRRELLDLLGQSPGSSASSLAARMPVSRQAVAQHLVVLEDSSLVTKSRAGREVLFTVSPESLAAAGQWLIARAALWGEQLK